MRSARRLIAFFSGLLLYCSAIGLSWLMLEGWLQQALRPHFSSYADTMMVAAGSVALLIFLLSVGWCYLSVRVPAGGRRPTTGWCLAGISAGCLGWVIVGAFVLALTRKDKHLTLVELLLVPTTPPLWGPFNALAVVAGLLLAGVLARRTAPPPRRSRRAMQTAQA